MKHSASWVNQSAAWRGVAVLWGVCSVISVTVACCYIAQFKLSWWARLKAKIAGKRKCSKTEA